MSELRVYMGWDPTETLAYEVGEYSILKRASTQSEVVIHPLKLQDLGQLLTRPILRNHNGHKMWCPTSEAPMSVEFAISRFCIPFLQHEGWALFVDCDIVCLKDITDLFALADPQYAVMCVKHQQTSGAAEKHGHAQLYYNRKNWSSVVLWNCGHPAHQRLTQKMLNTLPGRDLHAFYWLYDDEIGTLPPQWNYLVDVNPQMPKSEIGIAHYTMGGPWFKEWEARPSDQIWLDAYKELRTSRA